MLTKDEVDTWCRERGYSLHCTGSAGAIRSYSKQFDKFFLSLTVDLPRKEMQLQGFPGMFTLSTGNMQLCHPNFESFFEARMAHMMSAIENENTPF